MCDHDWKWEEYDCDCSADTSYAQCSKCGAVSHDQAVIEAALKRAASELYVL